MRPGLGAPTVQPPPANVDEIRAFLDGQSRIKAALWVSHDGGGSLDHHLVLGVADEDWSNGDMRALEEGMDLPPLRTHPTWVDIFPVSEVEELRAFGTVLWEQTAAGDDPLDYSFTYEPFAPEGAALDRFASLLGAEPAIRCVGATLEKLWKGQELVEERVQLFVGAQLVPNALEIVNVAARDTILVGRRRHGATLRPPSENVIYEAVA